MSARRAVPAREARRLLVVSWLVLLMIAAGCSGRAGVEPTVEEDEPLADGLALVPDSGDLGRHVLVGDLARLRRAYPAKRLGDAMVGVWLPDALAGLGSPLWREAFGLKLRDITSFVSAGFHPASFTVAEGSFSPDSITAALSASGYRQRGELLLRGADGSIDTTTEEGRLSLSALNRVAVSGNRITAASTSALARSAQTAARSLADDEAYAAVAGALDPITSAIVLDAQLVRPPSGAPADILPGFKARLIAVGVDDLGLDGRTIKIALVYADAGEARTDAAAIERDLDRTRLPGAPESRFSDIARDWVVSVSGSAVVLNAKLPGDADAGMWRLLVERGDLAVLVRH